MKLYQNGNMKSSHLAMYQNGNKTKLFSNNAMHRCITSHRGSDQLGERADARKDRRTVLFCGFHGENVRHGGSFRASLSSRFHIFHGSLRSLPFVRCDDTLPHDGSRRYNHGSLRYYASLPSSHVPSNHQHQPLHETQPNEPRWGIFSDLHFRQKDLHRLKDTCHWLRHIFQEAQVTHLFCLGDVFHDRHVVHVEALSVAAGFFRDLQALAPVEVLLGNHDLPLQTAKTLDRSMDQPTDPNIHARLKSNMQAKRHDISTLDFLDLSPDTPATPPRPYPHTAQTHSHHCRLHRAVSTIHVDGWDVLLVPWQDDLTDLRRHWPSADDPQRHRTVVMGHLAVAGAWLRLGPRQRPVRYTPVCVGSVSEGDRDSRRPLSVGEFQGFPMVLSGHYHSPHIVGGNVLYVGAPMQHGFQDAHSDTRGALLVDPMRVAPDRQAEDRLQPVEWAGPFDPPLKAEAMNGQDGKQVEASFGQMANAKDADEGHDTGGTWLHTSGGATDWPECDPPIARVGQHGTTALVKARSCGKGITFLENPHAQHFLILTLSELLLPLPHDKETPVSFRWPAHVGGKRLQILCDPANAHHYPALVRQLPKDVRDVRCVMTPVPAGKAGAATVTPFASVIGLVTSGAEAGRMRPLGETGRVASLDEVGRMTSLGDLSAPPPSAIDTHATPDAACKTGPDAVYDLLPRYVQGARAMLPPAVQEEDAWQYGRDLLTAAVGLQEGRLDVAAALKAGGGGDILDRTTPIHALFSAVRRGHEQHEVEVPAASDSSSSNGNGMDGLESTLSSSESALSKPLTESAPSTFSSQVVSSKSSTVSVPSKVSSEQALSTPSNESAAYRSTGSHRPPVFHAALESMEVENFLSLRGPLCIPFAKMPAGVYFLVGANGSGKSAVFEALTWCLFGEVLRSDMATSDVLYDHRGHKGSPVAMHCTVKVHFCNGYTIERTRLRRGAPLSRLVVYRHGKEQTHFSKRDYRQAQKTLERDLLGIHLGLFTKMVMFSDGDAGAGDTSITSGGGSSNSAMQFLTMSPLRRRDYIESFMGFQMFQHVMEVVRLSKSAMRTFQERLTDELGLCTTTTKQAEKHLTQCQQEARTWQQSANQHRQALHVLRKREVACKVKLVKYAPSEQDHVLLRMPNALSADGVDWVRVWTDVQQQKTRRTVVTNDISSLSEALERLRHELVHLEKRDACRLVETDKARVEAERRKQERTMAALEEEIQMQRKHEEKAIEALTCGTCQSFTDHGAKMAEKTKQKESYRNTSWLENIYSFFVRAFTSFWVVRMKWPCPACHRTTRDTDASVNDVLVASRAKLDAIRQEIATCRAERASFECDEMRLAQDMKALMSEPWPPHLENHLTSETKEAIKACEEKLYLKQLDKSFSESTLQRLSRGNTLEAIEQYAKQQTQRQKEAERAMDEERLARRQKAEQYRRATMEMDEITRELRDVSIQLASVETRLTSTQEETVRAQAQIARMEARLKKLKAKLHRIEAFDTPLLMFWQKSFNDPVLGRLKRDVKGTAVARRQDDVDKHCSFRYYCLQGVVQLLNQYISGYMSMLTPFDLDARTDTSSPTKPTKKQKSVEAKQEEDDRLALKLLPDLKLSDGFGKRSMGQRQSNALAVLFAFHRLGQAVSSFRPDFLLMDEVFSRLDLRGQRRVRRILMDLTQRGEREGEASVVEGEAERAADGTKGLVPQVRQTWAISHAEDEALRRGLDGSHVVHVTRVKTKDGLVGTLLQDQFALIQPRTQDDTRAAR